MKGPATSPPRRSPSPRTLPKTGSWRRTYWEAVSAWWLWELFGWLLSTACLMTIVGLLAHYDGKPLHNWPHSITLNSTLAILSAASKSALMIPVAAGISQLKWTRLQKPRRLLDLQRFDDASRGPLGSVSLIWRGGILAFLGTLVIITSLAFEPFIQQVVAYPSKRVDQGVTSSIPRSEQYSSYLYTGQTAPTPTVFPDMKAAIYTGMYTNGTDVIPLCSSGNCTWDTFGSVAICSACIDRTEDITIMVPTEQEPIWGSTSGCIMALQGGVGIASAPGQYGLRSLFNLSVGDSDSYLSSTDSTIVNFTSIYYDSGQGANCTEPLGTARATECNIFWCVNTYQAEMSNNVFRELTSASHPMLLKATGNNWDSRAFFYNDNNTNFQVDGRAQGAMREFMLQEIFLDGNATLSEHYNKDYTSDLVSLLYNAAAPANINGPQHGRNTKGITDFIGILTRTMTTNVRSTLSGASSSFDGIAWEQLTFIHVRWAWLVLPLMLDLLAVLFLLSVVIQTVLTKTEIWKSSQMATIFRGMSLRDLMDFGDEDGHLDMDEIARTVNVKLQQSGGQGNSKRLVKVS